MLELKKITKIYKTEGFTQKALDGVSIKFRNCEFASILGPSGSGKTTLLNIVGGLDHYDSGDLVINSVSTKEYNDRDWDTYRNHRVGFVFQSYNLISHQTVLSNVELALTLSGISKNERKKMAIKALDRVGLKNHINKKPSQLSGGQMQRVAIARALVNDPDIILADEPTGALDSDTSVQVMKILKEIAKEKLVVMVTHNPELAEEYSTRIIRLKDGKITDDTDPFDGKEEKNEDEKSKSKKTKMSYFTALSLSFNNLMTKKGRTILVSIAGSIGIIGIALILALSTGFQKYVDQIQEDMLSSYPLTIQQETANLTNMLLSMSSGNKEDDKTNTVKEQQYISSMLSSISTNDLKTFKAYLDKNKDEVNKNVTNIKYSYSIDPTIYTIDVTNKLAKVNPNSLFTSMYGSSSLASSFSSYSSIFSQMFDDKEMIKESYDILAGRLPDAYNESVLVLSEPNSISDLLVYSLGLRDYNELTDLITKVMSGETVKNVGEPLTIDYDTLMNVSLKLVLPTDLYKYNKQYKIYEDMSKDEKYMKDLYNKAVQIKIVGIVCEKDDSDSHLLSPGINYKKELIDYIISEVSKTDIVKSQLKNEEVDIFSGKRFDSDTNKFDFEFADLVTVDQKMMSSAFNFNIDQKTIQKNTEGYMNKINEAITTDIKPARELLLNELKTLVTGLFNSIEGPVSINDIDTVVDNYLDDTAIKNKFKSFEKDYILPSATYSEMYKGLLKGVLQVYITAYYTMDQSLTTDSENMTAVVVPDIISGVVDNYISSAVVQGTLDQVASYMTEAVMKTTILTKVGELTESLTKSIASSFNVDQKKITSAFKVNLDDDQIMRIMSAMSANNKDKTAKSNLINLGYQDIDDPSSISIYFKDFDGKENFMNFIDSYNDKLKKDGNEDSVIRYTDTVGLLLGSVKTIVNAVSYVLISFVSVSLVVSSIMIGIITYISVYERTKEIGILRAIGASKRNISSIFNAETFIIGFLSGLFGVGITYALIPVINIVIHNVAENPRVNAILYPTNAVILVVLSIVLTLIGGLIPSKTASRKDPVEALRTE